MSREALLRRLVIFGRTTEAFYRQKREQYLAEFMMQRQRQRDLATEDGVPRNMPQETVSNFGKPLVRMILGNYYQDRLTLSDISGYLRIKTKHIPKLEGWLDFDDPDSEAILQHRQQRFDTWLALRLPT